MLELISSGQEPDFSVKRERTFSPPLYSQSRLESVRLERFLIELSATGNEELQGVVAAGSLRGVFLITEHVRSLLGPLTASLPESLDCRLSFRR